MSAKIQRLNKSLIYLVISGLPFYYFFREYGFLASFIYSIPLILLFLSSLLNEFQRNLTKKYIFHIDFILEILIMFNIFFVIIYLNLWDRNLILLFVVLLIAKNLSRFEIFILKVYKLLSISIFRIFFDYTKSIKISRRILFEIEWRVRKEQTYSNSGWCFNLFNIV